MSSFDANGFAYLEFFEWTIMNARFSFLPNPQVGRFRVVEKSIGRGTHFEGVTGTDYLHVGQASHESYVLKRVMGRPV